MVTAESQYHNGFALPLTWTFILNSVIFPVLGNSTVPLRWKKGTELNKGKIFYKLKKEATAAFREWSFLTHSLG